MTKEKDLRHQTIYALSADIDDDTNMDVFIAGDSAREIIENSIAIIRCAQEAAMGCTDVDHIIMSLEVAVQGLENALALTYFIRQEAFKQRKDEEAPQRIEQKD